MIYLDHGATSFPKPPAVRRAMDRAMARCANPGRGGHLPAMEAAQTVYRCREQAAALFGCEAEQVAFTGSCTQGLNTAVRTLVRPGDRVLISGFEHNAVVRPLHALGADITVAGQKLFDWADTLSRFQDGLKTHPAAAVFTHVSNVFGYVLPVAELGDLCRQYGVPFVLDAAQSAGSLPVDLKALGAAYIAMPGHKGLLGPMGTGLLLCGELPMPLLFGGTGSESVNRSMPDFLPDRLEAGTLNVPGIGGLEAGLALVRREGPEAIGRREHRQAMACARALEKLGLRVFTGAHQAGTVSFLPEGDCEELARRLGDRGAAVRAGLHCAPLAHESAGTLDTGTVRLSFGYDAEPAKTGEFLRILENLLTGKM
ncbi:MAG: aminotransferase class V-fold PLP-dependent enzyme [Oscillospiraceae bacterium]|nr:aminotransferase class V-fold PLP-dependent enzyme [Oscillospiraceae bacterium]